MAPKRPSASPAGGDMPKRARKTYTLEQALTAANLSECMDSKKITQILKEALLSSEGSWKKNDVL
ncbi:hypothetical protein E2C01_100480 [Portunus trituberculatus]|uniref:Uncharacterized protein n=1 Tax=Portunus trituberculatus TaxID=210409 RepID=A0A5B7K857_PORTR|nr:hypothetical protein [Portunus trituberculatus]